MSGSGNRTPPMNEKADAGKGEAVHVETGSGTGIEDFAALIEPGTHLDAKAEKRMYRKMDWRLLPILALLYLVAFLDRGNIGNARLAGLEADLNMTPGDYALALSVFFIAYNLCEVPANLMLKKLSPKIWLSLIVTLFGICMIGMGLITNFEGLLAMRVLLGVFEAGLFPGAVYLLSLWYPRSLLQFRMAIFFCAATVAGAFSGLLAYGIQFMSGTAGRNGWEWIFILEGIFTTVCGAISYFFLHNYPETASFLTQDERDWAVWKKATDGTVAGEHKGMNRKLIMQGLFNWQVWLSVLYYISIVTPLYSISLFLPTIVNSFGTYTRPQVQLLTVPVYVFACIWVLVSSIWADKIQKRFIFLFFDQLCCIAGFIINITTAPNGVKFFGLFLIAAGSYAALPTSVAWPSVNLRGQTRRAVGVSAVIGFGNFGGLIASNIYRNSNGGRYFTGHGVNLGLLGMGIIVSPLYAYLLKRENARRDAAHEREMALPEDQRRKYTIQELHELADNAPDFRYTI